MTQLKRLNLAMMAMLLLLMFHGGYSMATEVDSDYTSFHVFTQNNFYCQDTSCVNFVIEERTGFKSIYDLTDPKVLCSTAYQTCSNTQHQFYFDLRQDLDRIKVYIPAGSQKVSLEIFCAQRAKMAGAVRFGQPPQINLGTMSYDSIPSTNSYEMSIENLTSADKYTANGGGSFVVCNDNNADVSQGGWLYVRIFKYDANKVGVIQHGNTLDVNEYLNWYKAVKSNGECWTSTGDPIVGCTGEDPGPVTGGITGRVYTNVTGATVGIKNAKVTLVQTGAQTTTDANGNYSFSNLETGKTYTIRLEASSDTTKYLPVTSSSKSAAVGGQCNFEVGIPQCNNTNDSQLTLDLYTSVLGWAAPIPAVDLKIYDSNNNLLTMNVDYTCDESDNRYCLSGLDTGKQYKFVVNKGNFEEKVFYTTLSSGQNLSLSYELECTLFDSTELYRDAVKDGVIDIRDAIYALQVIANITAAK